MVRGDYKALRGRITLGPAKPSAQDRKPTRGVHNRWTGLAPKVRPQPPTNCLRHVLLYRKRRIPYMGETTYEW
jgi:hypothetical protein